MTQFPGNEAFSNNILELFTDSLLRGAFLYSKTCLERPPHWAYKCGRSRQSVVFGGLRFNYIKIYDPLPGISGPSRQVFFKGSGLLRQVSLYLGFCIFGFRGDSCRFPLL